MATNKTYIDTVNSIKAFASSRSTALVLIHNKCVELGVKTPDIKQVVQVITKEEICERIQRKIDKILLSTEILQPLINSLDSGEHAELDNVDAQAYGIEQLLQNIKVLDHEQKNK